jgi:hypothetical protein
MENENVNIKGLKLGINKFSLFFSLGGTSVGLQTSEGRN